MSIKEVSCSVSGPDNTNILASSSEEKTQIKTSGLFYRIQNTEGVTRGYIFGSAHRLDMFDFKLLFDEEIDKRFNESNHLVVEVDAIKDLKKSMPEVENFNNIIKQQAEKLQSKEVSWLIQSHENGKMIHELETVEFQIEAKADYQKEIGKNIISKILRRPLMHLTPDEEKFYKEFDQKLAQKDQFTREGLAEGSEEKIEFVANFGLSEEVAKRFYDDRSEKMAEKTDSLLRENAGLFFIAIGAGHVVGKKGVPTLLSQRYGWQVTKMRYSN
jgi:uncharacterized protein YbaP (TraB family)